MAGLFGLFGCDDNSTQPDPSGPGTVVIQLAHVVDGEDLTFPGSYGNAAGNSYTVSNLEYVVSYFRLEAEGGTLRSGDDFEADIVHYRSHEQSGTRSVTLTDVPAGDYSHLRFTFGLPGPVNTAGAFPDLDTAGMAWPAPLGGGYHYMRHEGNYIDNQGATRGFTTHTGPSMGNDYSIEVELDLDAGSPFRHGFEVAAGETTTVRLSMNVNEWYANPPSPPYDFNDYALIMGNTAAQEILEAYGADVWSVAPPGE
jgi:hypothetical protein